MSDSLPPFKNWGPFKSTDANNPDKLEVKVIETETFETEYSTNVRVQVKEDGKWKDVILPLKSHSSTNAMLLNLWKRLVAEGKIKAGSIITILTWLGISRVYKRPIRRFRIVL